MPNTYSKAFSQYGSSMGRAEGGKPDEDELCKLHKVPLDSGGYDPGGAYWGSGDPLYRLQTSDGQFFTRAKSRFQAFLILSERLGVDFRVRP